MAVHTAQLWLANRNLLFQILLRVTVCLYGEWCIVYTYTVLLYVYCIVVSVYRCTVQCSAVQGRPYKKDLSLDPPSLLILQKYLSLKTHISPLNTATASKLVSHLSGSGLSPGLFSSCLGVVTKVKDRGRDGPDRPALALQAVSPHSH